MRLYFHRRSQDSALLVVKDQIKQVGGLLK